MVWIQPREIMPALRRCRWKDLRAVQPRCSVASRDSVALLRSQDLVHGPAFRQLIHQLVQVPDVPHERIFDLRDPDAADDAGDLPGIWMERWRFAEEGLEVLLSFNLLGERLRTVARQPADDFVDLLPGAPFHLGFPDVVGINAGEGRSEDSMLLHGFDLRRAGPLAALRQAGLAE